MRLHRSVRLILGASLLAVALAVPGTVSAHGHVEVGEFGLTIGWADEPTFVGQPNAVELSVEHHDTGEPYADLGAGDITVVVSTAGEQTDALPLEAAFGQPGVYVAELLPTAPGDYTFHFVGTIGDQAVDVEMTSGDDTFSGVRSSSDVEFPVKVPTLADVATRLDRIDGRIEGLPGADALAAANARADAAAASASQAMTIGLLVGGAGLVVAVVALWVAWRSGRRGTGIA